MDNITMNERTQKRSLFVRIINFSWLNKHLVTEIIALLFVVLFLYTGTAKLMEFDVFQEQLNDSPILEPVAPVVAWALPISEFIVSLALFLPKYRLLGLYAAFILMILFTTYVSILLSISTELPCSCGGIIQALSWQEHLIINLALVALSLVGIIIARKSQKKRGEL